MVADVLFCIPIKASSNFNNNELFLNRRVFENNVVFPLDIEIIREEQKNDDQLEKMLKDRRLNDRLRSREYNE